MTFHRLTFIVIALAVHVTVLAPTCFGTKKAYIPQFTSPVQNYAVIDISGDITSDVDLVALDDSNNAAFGFGTGSAPINFYESVFDKYHTYTWQNGTLGAENIAICWKSEPQGGDFYINTGRGVKGLLTTGMCYGGESIWNGGAPSRYDWFTSTNGLVSPGDVSNPPFDDTVYDYNDGNGASMYSLSEHGTMAIVASTSLSNEVAVDPNTGLPYLLPGSAPIHEVSVIAGTNTIIFDPGVAGYGPGYNSIPLPANTIVQYEGFDPSAVNDAGQAIGGYLDTSGAVTNVGKIWDGSTLFSLGTDVLKDLNEQGQVVGSLTNGDYNNTVLGEGYLWESQFKEMLRDTLPYYFENQDWNIQPFSISNQVQAASTDGSTSQGTDETIQILADAQSFDIDPDGKAVLTRDNNNKWHYAHVALPPNVSVTDWTSINSSGVIAAIGNGGHALLLVPVETRVTSDSFGGWLEAGKNQYVSFLDCDGMTITAKMKEIPGLPIKIRIVQDGSFYGADAYDDNSISTVVTSSSPGSRNFLADDDPDDPNDIGDPITDEPGYVGWKLTDHPHSGLTASPRHDIKSMRFDGSLRDFVEVTIGDNQTQIVAELKWSCNLSADFNPPTSDPAPPDTTLRTANIDVLPSPDTYVEGGAVIDQEVQSRGNTVNGYLRTSTNYRIIGGSSSIAGKYPMGVLSTH